MVYCSLESIYLPPWTRKRWIEAGPYWLSFCFQLFCKILQNWFEQRGHLNKKETITRRLDWSFWSRGSNVGQAAGCTGWRDSGCRLQALCWVYVCLHCCVFFFVNVSIPRCGWEYRCVVLSASGNIAAWCVCVCCVWWGVGGGTGPFCAAYHTNSIPEHSFSSI